MTKITRQTLADRFGVSLLTIKGWFSNNKKKSMNPEHLLDCAFYYEIKSLENIRKGKKKD